MLSILEFLQKRFLVLLPVFVFLGIVLGYFHDLNFLKILIFPLTFMMIFPPLISIDTKKFLSHEDLFLQIVAIFINLVFMPFFFYNLGIVFFRNDPILAGFLLIGLIPTTGMTLSWTALSKGDVDSSIKLIVINLFLSALTAPFYLSFFMEKVFFIPIKNIFYPIFIIIIFSIIFGLIIQKILIYRYGINKFEEEIKQRIPILSIIGVLGIAFVTISSGSPYLINHPLKVLYSSIPIILFYLIGYPAVTILGLILFEEKKAVSLLYGTVMRNFPLAIAISFIIFDEPNTNIPLLLSFSYIFQIESSGLYVALSKYIFTQDLFPSNDQNLTEEGTL